MSLKASISKHVRADNIVKRVPQEYLDTIDLKRLVKDDYTLVCFPGMRNNSTSIVDSKTLERALKKVKGTQNVIVVAHNFTLQALSLIGELNAIAYRKSYHHWSDESWAGIRDK